MPGGQKGSLELIVIIIPAVALLEGGTICQANRTAARTGGSLWQIPMTLQKLDWAGPAPVV
jgi:hypothetical protein